MDTKTLELAAAEKEKERQFELRKKDEEREFERLKIAAERNKESMKKLNLPGSVTKQRSLRSLYMLLRWRRCTLSSG